MSHLTLWVSNDMRSSETVFEPYVKKAITDGSEQELSMISLFSQSIVIVFLLQKKNRILIQTNQLLDSSFHMQPLTRQLKSN